MNCPDCGKPILRGNRYCVYCSYELSDEEFHAAKRKKRRSSGIGPLVIFIMVILLVVGGGIFAAGHFLNWFDKKEGVPAAQVTQTPQVTAALTPTALPLTARPSAAPMPTPSPVPAPISTAVLVPVTTRAAEQAIYIGDSTQELVDVLFGMISHGQSKLRVESSRLTTDEVEDLLTHLSGVDRYEYRYSQSSGADFWMECTIEWYPGIRIWHAVLNGEEAMLSGRDQKILQHARSAVNRLIQPGMSDLEKELALHDYIVYNCDYLKDGELDTKSIYGFYEHGLCQCSGYSDTFFLLGRLAGLEVFQQSGHIIEDGEAHRWNLIRLDGLWYLLDSCWDDPVGGGQETWNYFNVPLDVIAAERNWDPRLLPAGNYARELDEKWYFYDVPTVTGMAEAIASLDSQLAAKKTATVRLINPGKFDPQQVLEGMNVQYGQQYWWNLTEKPWMTFFSVWHE